MTTDALASLLQEHPFTEGFWPDHIARLAAMAGSVRFTRDELIFHEGDHSSFFYLLVKGNVALEVIRPGGPCASRRCIAGDVLGWSSVTEREGKQFQARALEAGARAGLRRRAPAPRLRRGLRLRVPLHARDGAASWRTASTTRAASCIDVYTPVGGGMSAETSMNIGVIRERAAFDRRVALTPAVVRRLTAAGHTVWVERGAGDGAMFHDTEYMRAGAQIAYSPAEVIQRVELLAKIGTPPPPKSAVPARHGADGLLSTWPSRTARCAGTCWTASPDRHRLRGHPAGRRTPAGARRRSARSPGR